MSELDEKEDSSPLGGSVRGRKNVEDVEGRLGWQASTRVRTIDSLVTSRSIKVKAIWKVIQSGFVCSIFSTKSTSEDEDKGQGDDDKEWWI
jgi:hypothetical protein